MIKITNIPAVNDAATQGKRIYGKIYVIAEEDVDYDQFPEISEEERTMAAFVLKTGAAGFKEFNFVKYTAGATSEGSAGDITSQVTNTLQGTLGGDSKEIDDLLENQIGKPFFVVISDRFDGKKKIYGRKFSPMFLTAFSKRKNSENTSCDITFSNESFFQPLEYLGSVTPSTPQGGGSGEGDDDGDGDENGGEE